MRRFEKNHEKRLKRGDCTVSRGIVYIELQTNLERIAAHLTNVAERTPAILKHRVELGTDDEEGT